MNELKPCPFCGSSEYVHTAYYHFDDTGTKAVVECSNCACSTHYFDDMSEAINAWNLRTHAPELKPCPFCGGAPMLKFYAWHGEDIDDEPSAYVECSLCHCTSLSSCFVDDVILAWNNRSNI